MVRKSGFLSDKRNKVCLRQQSSLVCRRFNKKHAIVPQRMVVFVTIQFSFIQLDLVPVPFEDALELAAKTFAPVCFRATDCALSSFLGSMVATFILSCASAFSSNHSLKLKKVGQLQSSSTVCIDQAFFMFVGSFCTASPKNTALYKSFSYFKERKLLLTRNLLH